LQEGAQVQFKVARVGAEGFLRGALAESAGLEVAEELLA
jgi:hypothetical protein